MRPLLFSLLAVPLLAAGIVFAACSDEGEGQPCDHLNGDNDCQSPNLFCQDIVGVQGWRCCPKDRSQATTPECALPSGVIDASPAPPDVRTVETSTQDSPGEAQGEGGGADAPAESTSDAPTESAADGGAGDAPSGG